MHSFGHDQEEFPTKGSTSQPRPESADASPADLNQQLLFNEASEAEAARARHRHVISALLSVSTPQARIAARMLEECGGDIQTLGKQTLDQISEGLGQALHRSISRSALNDGHRRHPLVILQFLEANREVFGEQRLKFVTNFRSAAEDTTPLHNLTLGSRDLELLDGLLALGADPALPAKFKFSGDKGWRQLSAIHLLIEGFTGEDSVIFFEKMLDAVSSPDLKDSEGTSLLLHALGYRRAKGEGQKPYPVLVDILTEHGANPFLTNRRGQSPFNYAMEQGEFAIAANMLATGMHEPLHLRHKYRLLSNGTTGSTIGLRELVAATAELSSGFNVPVHREMAALFREKHDPYHLYLYAYALHHQSADAFGRLTAHIPSYSPKLLSRFLAHFEQEMDRHNPPLRTHPFEAELLLLLSHPKDPEFDKSRVDYFTRAISSIPRFIENGSQITITGRKVENWASIGFHTFSFIQLRFDAMRALIDERSGAKRSLLEEFGLEYSGRRSNDEPRRDLLGRQHHGFGTGFVLWPGSKNITFRDPHTGTTQHIDPRTYVELRRAYYVVSCPENGTLIIRNSSPKFGRDTLHHPAYWSRDAVGDGFELNDVYNFRGPHKKSSFVPILDCRINRDIIQLDTHVAFLLGQLEGVLSAYRSWKFDTGFHTAWQSVPILDTPLLFGGANSPGFGKFIELCSTLYRRNGGHAQSAPGLAFLPTRRHLPWVPFEGSAGRRVLPLNGDVLAAMRDLKKGDYDSPSLERSGLVEFFQKAGFDTEGQLVLYQED